MRGRPILFRGEGCDDLDYVEGGIAVCFQNKGRKIVGVLQLLSPVTKDLKCWIYSGCARADGCGLVEGVVCLGV